MIVLARLSTGETGPLLGYVPKDFDLRTWAESRREAFQLLGIVGLEVIMINDAPTDA